MSMPFPVRATRTMPFACLIAGLSLTLLALPAQADDAGAQSFLLQEKARAAETKAPELAKKPARLAKAETAAPARERKAAMKGAKIVKTKGAKTEKVVANPLATAPEGLRAIVRREAAANNVPVSLAKAVVTIESRWNPRVTGSAGEVGLMQIKYATARMIGYRGTRAALYNPETNIKWGMKYLAGAHQLAGGDLCRTVSKYQGGHGVSGVTRMGATYCGKARGYIAAMPADPTPRLALNTEEGPRG
jgi:soluble lytic murein transglycosylase-like protein